MCGGGVWGGVGVRVGCCVWRWGLGWGGGEGGEASQPYIQWNTLHIPQIGKKYS